MSTLVLHVFILSGVPGPDEAQQPATKRARSSMLHGCYMTCVCMFTDLLSHGLGDMVSGGASSLSGNEIASLIDTLIDSLASGEHRDPMAP